MKRGSLWPIAIVSVLAITVAANLLLLHAAADTEGAVTEPDYYRKAVAWDSSAALARRSAASGWRCDAAFARAGRDLALRVDLRDAAGLPLEGVRVHVTAIHNLSASRPLELDLSGVEGGSYRVALAGARAGLWELRVTATRGGVRFAADLRRDAPAENAR